MPRGSPWVDPPGHKQRSNGRSRSALFELVSGGVDPGGLFEALGVGPLKVSERAQAEDMAESADSRRGAELMKERVVVDGLRRYGGRSQARPGVEGLAVSRRRTGDR